MQRSHSKVEPSPPRPLRDPARSTATDRDDVPHVVGGTRCPTLAVKQASWSSKLDLRDPKSESESSSSKSSKRYIAPPEQEPVGALPVRPSVESPERDESPRREESPGPSNSHGEVATTPANRRKASSSFFAQRKNSRRGSGSREGSSILQRKMSSSQQRRMSSVKFDRRDSRASRERLGSISGQLAENGMAERVPGMDFRRVSLSSSSGGPASLGAVTALVTALEKTLSGQLEVQVSRLQDAMNDSLDQRLEEHATKVTAAMRPASRIGRGPMAPACACTDSVFYERAQRTR